MRIGSRGAAAAAGGSGRGRRSVTGRAVPRRLPADMAEFFGSIGIIKIDKKTKKPKIWLYRDKNTGGLKGDGTVTYDDPFSASSAVEWFNKKDWKGGFAATQVAPPG